MIRARRTGWARLAVAAAGAGLMIASDVVVPGAATAIAAPAPPATASPRPPTPLASPPVRRPAPTVPAGGYATAPAAPETSATEDVSRRTATSATWRNRDGSLTVRQYAAPHYYRPSASAGWQPIDSSLAAVGGHPGSYASGANNWHATFGPAGASGATERISLPGHTIALSPRTAGRPATVPVTAGPTAVYLNMWTATDVMDRVGPSGVEEDIVLRSPAAPASFRFDLGGATAHANGSGGVDLTAGGTVLGSIPAPVVYTAGPAGPADPTRASGARLTATAATVEVSVSRAWLASLPASAFPVVIDPTVNLGGASPTSVIAYSSTGTTSTTVAVGHNASGTWAGAFQLTPPPFPAQQTGQPWQITYADLNIDCPSPCTLTAPKLYNETAKPTSYNAVPTGYLVPGVTGAGTGHLEARVETDTVYTSRQSSWFGLVANAPTGTFFQIPTADISMTLTFTENPPPATMVSPANGSVLTTTTPTLTGHLTDANICPDILPPWPANCDLPIQLYYNFRISTAPTATAGQTVAESGWATWPTTESATGIITPTTPTWTVPAGSLLDGATYYAVLAIANDPQYPAPPWSSLPAPEVASTPTMFQIRQRMGAGGPSPIDNIGSPPGTSGTPSEGAPAPGTPPASETVDMVTGNLAFTLPTRSMTTVGGPVGIQLGYDSIRSSVVGSTNYGLTARYYHDSGTHAFPATVAAQRIDPSVNLNGSASVAPIGGISIFTGYVVRWSGTITMPAGTWKLGGVSTGGLRIFVNGATTPTYNDWAGNGLRTPTFSTSTIVGPRQVAIQVEAWESGQNQSTAIQLWATDAASTTPRTFIVPSNWLTPAATGLPPGWSIAGTSPGTLWNSLTDLGAEVVVRSVTGDTSTFTKNSDGSYRPQPGRGTDYLTVAGGLLRLSTGAGMQYTFNPDGSLAAATTAADDRHPSSVQYTYGPDPFAVGNPAVLQSMTDPVSGQSVALSYGTSTGCPITNAVGLLCAVRYWDGSVTSFVYNTNNQLAEVINPGNAATLFAYDTANRISLIRDTLANDYIASAPAGLPAACTTTGTSANCPFDTQIGYDTQGRVTSVLQPAPTIGAARPKRTYVYAAGTTTVKIAGFAPTSGAAGTVTYDAKSRITRRTDAAGHPSYTVWDATDRPIISVDATGEQTSTVWDLGSNITDTYGPAPMACFDPATVPAGAAVTAPVQGYLPLAAAASTTGCKTTPPHTHHGYDEGMTGLARTYWPNGQFAGAPAMHTTGSDGPAAECSGMGGLTDPTPGDSDADICARWPAGTAPVATDAQHRWSERMSGSWRPGQGGPWLIFLQAFQPFTVYLDGVPVITNVTFSATGAPTGITTNPVGGSFTLGDTAPHHVDLQFEGDSTVESYYYLVMAIPGIHYMPFVLGWIDPGYGLATSTTDPDGKTMATGYTGGGLDAQFGLPTSTTADPGGLALTSTTTYETPGPASFLRPLSKTLPAGTATTYAYYGGTDGPLAAACGVPAGTPQAGLLRTQVEAATAGTAAREEQFIYDAEGRLAGRRMGSTTDIGTAGWRCTTYDARGRVLQQSWPAVGPAPARTVTYAYAVGGDPTRTSVSDTSDPGGTVTTSVDLLGRLVSYTDALGQTTTTGYDQAGRQIASNGVQGSLTDTYDPQTAQLTGVTRNGTTLATVTYDAATGRMAKVTYGNGTTGTLTYGPVGTVRGTTYTNTATGAFVTGDIATLSPAGRMVSDRLNINGTGLTNPNPAGDTAVDYTYDGAGRLVGAYLPGELATYGYDPNPAVDACPVATAGADTDRTRVTVTPTGGTATTTDYCYNQADQLTASLVGSVRNSQYAYDPHGNQTNDHGTTLAWDAADRLVKTTSATGVVTTYAYDPLDRLIGRTTGATTVRYAYSGFTSGPAATLTAAGTVNQQFVPLPNGVLLTAQASGDRWSYPDRHDNYTVVTDGSGVPQGAPVAYDPWGQPIGGPSVDNVAGGAKLGPFGVDGKFTDATTGITIMGARPYNAGEARFMGIDPVAGGCANAYTYAFGDPLSQQDLDGRDFCAHLTVLQALDYAAALKGGGRLAGLLAKFGVGGPEAAAFEEVFSVAAETYAFWLETAADTAAFMAKRARRDGFRGATGMVLMDIPTLHVFGHDFRLPVGGPAFIPYLVGGDASGGTDGGGGGGGC